MDAVAGLYSVLLYVHDLGASLGFYRDRLGLRQLGPADDSVAMLDAGKCMIVLHRTDGRGRSTATDTFQVGGHAVTFQVDDPDAWAVRLRSGGVPVVQGPMDQVWGRVVFVTDPDGRTVALARPTRVS